MVNLGDIRRIDGSKVEPVDLVIGGSPCQNLSVAGNRKGLEGDESSLFYEQIRVLKEMMQNNKSPKYFIWENVYGALKINNGQEFSKIISEFCGLLSGSVSLPKIEKWPSAGFVDGENWSIAWRVHDAKFWGVPQRRKRIALVADFTGRSAGQILFEPKSERGDKTQDETKEYDNTKRDRDCIAINGNSSSSGISISDISHSIKTSTRELVLCTDGRLRADTVSPTMCSDHNSRIGDYCGLVYVPCVRRFTPLECERLQGFPDNWTNAQGVSETQRYKMLGNSIALPFWQHLLNRIIPYCENKTMGSLFNGIGCFPLCWQRAGGKTLWISEIDKYCDLVMKKNFTEYEG